MTTEQTPPTPPQAPEPPSEVDELRQRIAALEELVATPAPVATTTPEVASSGATGFAVYDTVYEKYVGDVHATAKDARAAAKDAGVTAFRVDPV